MKSNHYFFLGHRTAKCLESGDSQYWEESFGGQGTDWQCYRQQIVFNIFETL